jgi:K+-sensing histidine kinase KdpD
LLGFYVSLFASFSPSPAILLLVPLSIGIAVLRYKLYNIDVLINRTLIYGTVTGMLALVYFSLVFVLQFLLRGLISQTNDVAIVVSTLAVAVLFQPLRGRIQQVIDRRFYRRKYDAARTLSAFSSTLRGETDLTRLSEQLVAVIQETMQPAHVSLWLRPTEQDRKHPATWITTPPVP